MVGAGLVLVVLALFGAGVQLGAAVVTRHRAEAAADLAALAAAARAVYGQHTACGSAERVARRMAGQLVSCELDGWDAVVRVTARPPGLIERLGVANATARAGPAAEG